MELNFPFELKSAGEGGQFTGLASTYSTVDLGGDLVVPGAFVRTLREKGDTRPLLWSHNIEQPVGLGRLVDTPAGLEIHGQLDLDTQIGRETYSRLKKKIVKGLSIGYRSAVDKMVDGVRHLLDVDLFETSLCLFPMNSEAGITAVKSRVTSIRAFESWLHGAGWSKSEALKLASHGWPGLAVADAGEDELTTWLRSRIAS